LHEEIAMPTEENKALVCRLFDEVGNQQTLAVSDEVVAPTLILDPDLPSGPEGVKAVVTWQHRVFAGLHYTVEDLVAEENKVAVRLSAQGTQVAE
jgi:hypothetical protein